METPPRPGQRGLSFFHVLTLHSWCDLALLRMFSESSSRKAFFFHNSPPFLREISKSDVLTLSSPPFLPSPPSEVISAFKLSVGRFFLPQASTDLRFRTKVGPSVEFPPVLFFFDPAGARLLGEFLVPPLMKIPCALRAPYSLILMELQYLFLL